MIIHLRDLKPEDALGMLDWLNDESINQYFTFSNEVHNIEYARNFIINANLDAKNKHFAIVDTQDEYIGTISLKNIDLNNKNAEYAIAIRKKYHGLGIGFQASQLLLDYARRVLALHKIYLTVLTDNEIAIHLYQKIGFRNNGLYSDHILKEDKYLDLSYFEIILDEGK